MTTKEKIPLIPPSPKGRGRRLATLLAGVLAAAGLAGGAEPVPPTTAFTRTLLRSTNAAQLNTALGFLSTNMTSITNYSGNAAAATNLNADELRSGTVAAARLTAPVGAVATNFAGNLTNLNANALTGTVAAARLTAPLQLLSTNNASGLTNLDGTKIQAGTVNSNALDTATVDWLAALAATNAVATNAIANTNGVGNNTTNLGTFNIESNIVSFTDGRGTNVTDLQVLRSQSNHAAFSDGATIGGGKDNQVVNSIYGTIGGGISNQMAGGGSANYGTIGGGSANYISSVGGTVGGGTANFMDADVQTIGGGNANTNRSHGGTIAGGDNNFIGTSAETTFIGGGSHNTIENDAGGYGTIAGGQYNTLGTESGGATIAGGQYNTNTGGGSIIAGGSSNQVLALSAGSFGSSNLVTANGAYAFGNGISNGVAGSTRIGPGGNALAISAAGGVSVYEDLTILGQNLKLGASAWTWNTADATTITLKTPTNASLAAFGMDSDNVYGLTLYSGVFTGNGAGLTNVGGLSTNGNNYFTGSNTFAGGLTVSGALILTNDGVQMYSLSSNPGVPEWDVDVDGVTRTKTSYGFFSGENRLWSTGYVGNASGATNLNATELRSGIVAPDRLGGTNGASDGWSWTLDNGTNKLALIAGGAATNAVATISSNGVAIATTATNLDFWPGANLTLYVTNRDGHADVAMASTGGAGATFDPNQFGAAAGGTNLVDGVPLTNANIYVKALISVAGGGEDVALASITGSVLQFSSTSAPWGADAAYLSATGMVAKAFSGIHGGNGAALTALNASSLASGTVPLERLAGVVITNGYPNAVDLAGGLTAPSITITGAGPGSLMLSNAAGTARVVELGTNSFINTNLTVAGTGHFTNLVSGQVDYSTNSGSAVAPDFTKGYTLLQTNAAFTILAPTGVDVTKAQTTVYAVTNSTAVAVVITAPANVHPLGTWYVTNLSEITFHCYGGRFTNAICLPIW